MLFKRALWFLVSAGVASTSGAYARAGAANDGSVTALDVWPVESVSRAFAVSVAMAVSGSRVSRAEAIHQTLYTIYKKQRKFDLAEKESIALTSINPNNALIHQDWGHELMVAQRFLSALQQYLKVVNIEPTNADAWACIGECYMQLRNYDAAAEAFRKAVLYQKPGTDYRPRLQLDLQYIDHARQQKIYDDNLKKQKEASDD